MIRLVSQIEDKFTKFCENNALGVKINSSLKAYGINQNFAMFWEQTDENDDIISVISKVDNCVTVLGYELDVKSCDELKEFVNVIGYNVLCLPENLAMKMFDESKIHTKSVMKYFGAKTHQAQSKIKEIDLFDLYKLIFTCHNLDKTKEKRDMFVTDLSHRIRHKFADAYAVVQKDKYVSCAVALSITETDVLLGGVATYSEYRKNGYAKKCIYELIRRNSNRNIFIFCEDDKIEFYNKLEFRKISNMVEVKF